MTRQTLISRSGMAAAIAITASAVAMAAGTGLEISSATVDGGGGTSTGGGYELTGTIGQPDASPALTSASFELTGGFWAGGPADEPCPGNTNGDGAVDVTDLVNVILDWNTDGSAHGGDVDGSGLVDVSDLVDVILAWGLCNPY